MKYCHCGAKFSVKDAVKVPAPSDWQADEAWKCVTCNLIHHAVQKAVSVVRGPLEARALLRASVTLQGKHLLTWSIGSQFDSIRTQVETVEFFPWPRRFPMTETEPLIWLSWKLLMSKLPDIMEVRDHETKERAKYEARGIAEVLAIQMKPFMTDADHVVRCAVKKFKEPDFEVPGLGEHLWNPMMNPDGTARTPITSPKTTKAKPVARPKQTSRPPIASAKTLSASEISGVKEAIGSGILSEEEVATMFKVTVQTVRDAVTS